jgi:hypothetical protein
MKILKTIFEKIKFVTNTGKVLKKIEHLYCDTLTNVLDHI